jgi:hypothetical protein
MRHEPHRLMQGLRDDDAIKRVAMERWQRGDGGRMVGCYRKELTAARK